MQGKLALITGSSGGLGFAIARALAAAGCRIVLHGIEASAVNEAQRAQIAREHRVDAHYRQANLADPQAIEAMMRELDNTQGGVDILVNNAVVRHSAPVDAFPVDKWDQALAVNLSAAFHTIRLALPHMRRQQWGRIVNMSSVYGSRATPQRIDYVTTKSGLLGMTRAVALEAAADGITCNAACPGSVLTPGIDARVETLMAQKALPRDAAVREFLTGKQPSGHFISAAHVAALIVFLCSPAGGDINGAMLPMEGGWLAG